MNPGAPKRAALLGEVLGAYVASADGALSNDRLYDAVASAGVVEREAMEAVRPVGRSGQRHSVMKRSLRWAQQSLKAMGLVERTDERGVWRLTKRNPRGLHEAAPGVKLVAFSTHLGLAVWGDCTSVLAGLDQPIALCVTSPPYLLQKPRAYGNPRDEAAYIDFLCMAVEPIVRHLAQGGSICINLPNDVFEPGLPVRSLYLERLVLQLHDRFGLSLVDRLVWMNPCRPPGPVQWASKARVQLNATHEFVLWFTNNPRMLRADNRRVLEAHTTQHTRLMVSGGEAREGAFADGAYRLRKGSFGNITDGRIPRNVLVRSHVCADSNRYRADARALGLPVHGAMQPLSIPDFLIRLMTEPGDLVVDPFGGTAKTGMAAELLGRRWLVVEKVLDYLRASAERFRSRPGFAIADGVRRWPSGAG